jgi:transcriptional regulator with XRE-family HTH domain
MPKKEHDADAEWRKRLREAIRSSGKTHARVALQAGVSVDTLDRLLSGETDSPRIETLKKIARAAGTTVGWLLDEPGYSVSPEQRKRLRDAAATIEAVTREKT